MKKIIVAHAVISLISFSQSVISQEVSIPDPALRRIMIEAANADPTQPLAADDFVGITTLTLNGAFDVTNPNQETIVTDLRGIELAKNLSSLILTRQPIGSLDFSILEALEFLRTVNIVKPKDESSTPDFSGLFLPNLTHLTLESRPVESFDFLSGLPGLEGLHLTGVTTPTLTIPENLQQLKRLQIDGASPLSELNLAGPFNQLEELVIGEHPGLSIHLPDTLPELRELTLAVPGQHGVIDWLSRGPSLPKLEKIRISNGSFTSLHLKNLPSLAHVEITHSDMQELHCEGSFPQLTDLIINKNELLRIDLDGSFPSLKNLLASENIFRELTIPQDATQLAIIDVRGVDPSFLSLPQSVDLNSLIIVGFAKESITLYGGGPSLQLNADGQLELSWQTGLLQTAETVDGPWNDLPDATSPHLVDAAAASVGFFRLRL